MRVAIDVNGVLRDTIGKTIQVYEKNLLDNNTAEEKIYEFMSEDWVEKEKNIDFKYAIKKPITSLSLKDFFSFKTESDFYSFFYEEYTMEIFGHAGSSETLSFNYLNNFYFDNREFHDILIVSDEIGKSKPATLFFLSKFGCLVETIRFFSNSTINSMWDQIDILLTANPELLLNYPENKIVIKYNTEYNQKVSSKYEISTLSELNELIKNL